MNAAKTLMTIALLAWMGLGCLAQEQPAGERARSEQADEKPPAQREPGTGEWDAHPPERGPRPEAEHRPGHGGPPGPARALLDMVRHHRPELAERLEGLWRRSPGRFHDVLVEALVVRLEDVLNETEHDMREGGEKRGPHGEMRPVPPPPDPESVERMREKERRWRELEEQHERLEIRSHELAAEIRRLREEGAGAEPERLRDELRRVVSEQFEVRGELRRTELERAEHEVRHLQELVERIERDLAQRARQREPIIERRIRQLLGEDRAGW